MVFLDERLLLSMPIIAVFSDIICTLSLKGSNSLSCIAVPVILVMLIIKPRVGQILWELREIVLMMY